MGEAKRREAMRSELEKLTRSLTDKGLLVEAGFVGLRAAAMSPDAPQIQVDEMRMAFMAGAQHLFASIMTILDPGEEPTNADLRRMDLIDKELRAFGESFQLQHTQTKGTS